MAGHPASKFTLDTSHPAEGRFCETKPNLGRLGHMGGIMEQWNGGIVGVAHRPQHSSLVPVAPNKPNSLDHKMCETNPIYHFLGTPPFHHSTVPISACCAKRTQFGGSGPGMMRPGRSREITPYGVTTNGGRSCKTKPIRGKLEVGSVKFEVR